MPRRVRARRTLAGSDARHRCRNDRSGDGINGVRLICDGAAKDYGGAFGLGPLSLEIGSGVTCLVGPNGAGKSTFFRLVAGVEKPTSGQVRLQVSNGSSRLGYLPQDPTLPDTATCEQFLHYVAWLQGVPGKQRTAAVAHALAAVDLESHRSTRIRRLSGGMRRRLGIAHALVHDPGLLLLDEPTAGLDPRQRIMLRETVAAVSAGRVVIVSTHLVEDVRGLADRVVVLDDGAIVYDGDVADLQARADPEAPGDTDLERAIATLIGAGR